MRRTFRTRRDHVLSGMPTATIFEQYPVFDDADWVCMHNAIYDVFKKSVGLVEISLLIFSQILEEMKLLTNVDVAQDIASPTYGKKRTLIKWDRVP